MQDLTTLASVFEAGGLAFLHVTHGEDGFWYATFEMEDTFEEPDANIQAMLEVIESLAPEHKQIWSGCDLREFNIGYDCGDEPWAFNQSLSSKVLSRIATAAASLRWTLYPDRSEIT